MPRYRTDHAEEWKNELAQDMNYLIQNAESHLTISQAALDEVIQRLCARLAEAEEIKEVAQ